MKRVKRELKVWKDLTHENILPLVGIVNLSQDLYQPSFVTIFMENGEIECLICVRVIS